MNKILMSPSTLPLLFAVLSSAGFAVLSSSASAATNDIASNPMVEDITCNQLLELNKKVMPMTVGYLYATSTVDNVTKIEDIDSLNINKIIGECTSSPDVKAIDIIHSQITGVERSAELAETLL